MTTSDDARNSNICRELAKNVLPKGTIITHAEATGIGESAKCLIDYKEPELRSQVESNVDCDGACESAIGEAEDDEQNDKAFDECVKECEDKIEKSITGSIYFDKKSLSVRESTIPLDCDRFSVEGEEFSIDITGKQAEALTKKLNKIGCTKMDIGWMHPHEFMSNPVEIEQDPAICYLHVQPSDKGKCNLTDVAGIVWGRKKKTALMDFSRKTGVPIK